MQIRLCDPGALKRNDRIWPTVGAVPVGSKLADRRDNKQLLYRRRRSLVVMTPCTRSRRIGVVPVHDEKQVYKDSLTQCLRWVRDRNGEWGGRLHQGTALKPPILAAPFEPSVFAVP